MPARNLEWTFVPEEPRRRRRTSSRSSTRSPVRRRTTGTARRRPASRSTSRRRLANGQFAKRTTRRRTARTVRRTPIRRTPVRRAASRTTRPRRRTHRMGAMPERDEHGRFIRHRVYRPVNRPARPQRLRPDVVREASRRSEARPALVRRRWWRIDGPVDPQLPAGYAYPR